MMVLKNIGAMKQLVKGFVCKTGMELNVKYIVRRIEKIVDGIPVTGQRVRGFVIQNGMDQTVRFTVAMMIHLNGIFVIKQLVKKNVTQIGTGQTVQNFARKSRKVTIHATMKQGLRLATLTGLVKIAHGIAKRMTIIAVMLSVY